MKKGILLIIIIVIVMAGVGVGTYFLTREKETKTNINTNTQEATTQNTNLAKPQVTYEKFASEDELITFESPTEWIKVASEEVMKASTLEQRNYYNIIHYSSTLEGVPFTVGKKSLASGSKTLEEVVEDDQKFASQIIADYQVINQSIREDFAVYSAKYTLQGVNYTTYSKELKINKDDQDWFYIAEVSIPENLMTKYSDIMSYILDSFSAK